MKNRALLLALKNGLETVEQYALKMGISKNRADLILRQKAILTKEEIERNCKIFGVSAAYFLCEIE